MTQEELESAVNRLIEEANEQSLDAYDEMEKDVYEIKEDALGRRAFRSSAMDRAIEKRREEYDSTLLRIQKDLDESLAALYAENEGGGTEPGEGIDPDSAPYEVDYSLPMRDRYVAVKNYYLAYDDLALALEDLNNDAVAKDYLGSYYDYLVQLLLMMQT